MKSKAEMARDSSTEELATALGLLTGLLLSGGTGQSAAESAADLLLAYKEFIQAVRDGERLRITNANSN